MTRNQDRRFTNVLIINNETRRMKVVSCRRGHVHHVHQAYRFSTVVEIKPQMSKAIHKLMGKEVQALETFDSV